MTNQSSSSREFSPGRWTLSDLLLGAGFGLTGVGTVMLGVLLPLLSERWGMRDDAAGFLLFLQFLGASLGASLLGPRRVRGLIAGFGLLAVSVCALAFAGMHLSFVLFFFVGLGLGMAMTATSLLFSDRYPGDRAARLERLNFAWAAGASAGPVLFLPFLRLPKLDPLFFTLTGLFLLLFLWAVLREHEAPFPSQSSLDGPPEQQPLPLATLLPLLLMAVGSVGIEASMSGWLTTYSHRADSQGVGGAVFAPSLFWFGIVISRLLFSTRLLAIVGRRRLLRATLWGVAAALALLMAAQYPASIRAAAMLAGLSIGPLYPLLLSFILKRSSRGWIFAVAGIGSALLPWLTGVFSAHFGSLRYGLIAPGGAAVLMVLLSLISLRSTDSTGPATA